MLEVIVALLGAAVGVVGSLITTSFRIGSEKQARDDLSARHSELAKEVRAEIAVLKSERENSRDRSVEAEKAILLLGQRLDSAQTQIANRATLDAERMEHFRQQLESKASLEVVSNLEKQIAKIDEKLDQLLHRAAAPKTRTRG